MRAMKLPNIDPILDVIDLCLSCQNGSEPW